MPKNEEVDILGGGEISLLGAPRIVIGLASWQTIMRLVRLCDTEVKGRGTVDVSGEDIVLDNLFILTQNASLVRTDDSQAFHGFYARMAREGRETEIARYCFEWHSHVHMPARFSKEDLEAIAGYATMFDFMVSLVVNTRAEYACRLDVYKPVPLSVSLPVYISPPQPSAEINAACLRDIAEHVRTSATWFHAQRIKPQPEKHIAPYEEGGCP